MVGCGGTGSLVAEGLCRLLQNHESILTLIDSDRVEPPNLRRQNFYSGDLGKFKSEALAERLANLYSRRIRYSVFPFERDSLEESWGETGFARSLRGLIIGCVDNPEARREIAMCVQKNSLRQRWWLDAGNGHDSGQVLFGNMVNKAELINSFDALGEEIRALPAPSLQIPSILAPPTDHVMEQIDCAEAIEDTGQSPVINQAMATLVLEFVYKLLNDQLGWMAAYLNLEAGTLRTVQAEPVTVARMFSLKVKNLMYEPGCSRGIMLPSELQHNIEENDLVETE